MVSHQTLIAAIQRHLNPNLLSRKYRKQSNPLAGHCYVASEAFYHLAGGKEAGLKPMQLSHEGKSHWFILDTKTSQVVDITASQFIKPVPYSKAVGRGFLTRNPSKRAQTLMRAIQNGFMPQVTSKVGIGALMQDAYKMVKKKSHTQQALSAAAVYRVIDTTIQPSFFQLLVAISEVQ